MPDVTRSVKGATERAPDSCAPSVADFPCIRSGLLADLHATILHLTLRGLRSIVFPSRVSVRHHRQQRGERHG